MLETHMGTVLYNEKFRNIFFNRTKFANRAFCLVCGLITWNRSRIVFGLGIGRLDLTRGEKAKKNK